MTIVRKAFSEAEEAYLQARVNDGPAALAKALGRTYASVRDHMRLMGLILVVRARIAWTEEHDAQLRLLCAGRLGDRVISKRMGCSEDIVRARRHELKIVKPPRGKCVSPRALKRKLAEAADLNRAAPTAPSEQWLSRDQAFVRRLLSDGGMPRAEIINNCTVWVGPDNRLWRGLTRRIAA